MPRSSSASKLVCALVAVWSGLGCLEGLRAFFDFLNQHIVGYGNQGAMSAVLTPVGDPCLTRVAGKVQIQIQVIGPAVPGTSQPTYPTYGSTVAFKGDIISSRVNGALSDSISWAAKHADICRTRVQYCPRVNQNR